MTPQEFMFEYARRTNTHQTERVADLIADDAVYWFNDGSFQGLDAIKQALAKTWNYIRDEHYAIEDVRWLAIDEQVAVCIHHFHWQGLVQGHQARGSGRGTSLLRKVNDQWKVAHEHLSSMPADS